MKNIALIFAGGVGSRMKNTDKPKQFLELDSKPIIIHTIEKFEKCNVIDSIAIACKKEYIGELKEMLVKFSIKKVKWIVPGGDTGQLSIYNALESIKNDNRVHDDTVVLIHDGVRPIITNELILENIVTARTHGNAITVVNAIETSFVSKNSCDITEMLKREEVFHARAPQTFFLNEIYTLHKEEMGRDNFNNIDSCSIMHKNGYKLNFVVGKTSNIKITTYEDYFIFKALYELEKEVLKEATLK